MSKSLIPSIHTATVDNKTDTVKQLLLVGVQVDRTDFDGFTPIQIALDVEDGYSLIHRLVSNENNLKLAELLLEKGVKVNDVTKWEESVIHLVAWYNRPEYINLLKLKGASINVVNSIKGTAMHNAAFKCRNNSHLEVIKRLLANGASVNAQNKDFNTPLHLMLHYDADEATKNHETIMFLLDNRADVNSKNSLGLSPLHYSARNNVNHQITQQLIIKGAYVNSYDHLDRTPLICALNANWLDSCLDNVKVLVDNGADLNVDYNGKTPLELIIHNADENLSLRILKLLLDNNAEFSQEEERNMIHAKNTIKILLDKYLE